MKAVTKGAQVPAIYNYFFDKFYLAKAIAEIPRGLVYRAKGDLAKARADLEHALVMAESRGMEDLMKECRKDMAALGQ